MNWRWIVVVAAVGCSTWSVKSSSDPSAVSRPYRTFAWATPAQSQSEQQLEQEVERQLVAKGMVPVAPEQNPDVVVSYDVVQVAERPLTRPGAFDAVGRTFGAMGSPRPTAFGFVERTLVLRFNDVRSQRAFWTGSATAAVASVATVPELTGAADEILRRFPTQTVAAR
jgi:hypothetical protein